MNDSTAAAVNWLAQGRTASMVAPTVRAATAPQAHHAARRLRGVAGNLTNLDPAAAQRALVELSRDRRFRQAVNTAAHRIELAASQGRRSRRRRWFAILALVVGAAAVASRLMRSPQAQHSAPAVEPMPVDIPAA
ncbi:MAG: hypothetical protein U0Y82_06045 [Thermoleophilia bacterium]